MASRMTPLSQATRQGMSHQIALFRFRLSKGQSIGPSALRKLWSDACGSKDVDVSRESSDYGSGDRGFTYSLCGSPRTPNMHDVERRLRSSLAVALPGATINLTCL
jgi:hypothetical protein